ncbi:MAG: glycerophosphodiester phosphodiesterase family protein [Gallintestinimicrobium sp.]
MSSFNHLSALSCKDFMPDMKTGALVGNGGIANAGYYCKKFGFECYHPGIEGLTKEEVELCHKNGIEVNVWTINNMDDLENMYEWGCDGVITNYPDVCKSWLEAKKAKR